MLNLLISFLSPAVDPAEEDDDEELPLNDGEHKPFIRKLPEFKFWFEFFDI